MLHSSMQFNFFMTVTFMCHVLGDSQGNSVRTVDPEEFFEVKIDIRKFAQFLAGQQVSPSRVICSKYTCTVN